ncbi:MAG: PilZ domain-containing protein [Desulfuromonadaceae bacterium]|nr:PilZ domain-containing protein [Desulfuromonadaceae bacterium]
MNSHIYHLVTVNDGKSDNAAIVNVFSEMTSGRLKSDFRLLNYCDEVPVSYGATITTVEKDSVELAVHEHQALVIKQDNSTLIKSKHFHNELGVHCYAAYVNVNKKTAILHNFAYAQIRAERREAVRVAVHGLLPVKFSYENVNIEGKMLDISGLGISFISELLPATNTDQTGLLNFTLDGNSMVVPGSFVRAIKHGNNGHICIFQMSPDRKSDTIIGHYIYQRQVEIIQRLKEGLVPE